MEERTLKLTNNSNGFLHHLNFPREMPQNVDFVQHLVVPLGEVISLELHGVVLSADNCAGYEGGNEPVLDNSYHSVDVNSGNEVVTGAAERGGGGGYNHLLEIYDNYADVNGTKWILCARRDHRRSRLASARASAGGQRYAADNEEEIQRDSSPVFITSYLNTLHIRQRSSEFFENGMSSLNQRGRTSSAMARLNATVKVYEDKSYRPKLASRDVWVESCQPNPCQFGGKCVDTKEMKKCACRGHYSGRFCGLTICDFDPCLFGTCELTETSFKCNCLPGYLGSTCEQKQKPCDENPCHGRGECFEKNNGFYCR